MSDSTERTVHAKDCECCECGAQAIAFWPMVDPDIPHYPYCQECLDKARNALMAKMVEEGLIGGEFKR